MKKTLRALYGAVLFIALSLTSNPAKSQQSLIQVNGWNAYVHLPSDYSTSKVYPTIIEFPGTGEVGSNASLVIEYGPGAYITQGWNGNVGSVEFIVISLQPPAIYPSVSSNNAEIASLKALYKIDPANLFLTGYSEGGWCSSMFVSSDPVGGPYTYASQIKAICTIEGVKPDDNSDYPNGFAGFAKGGGKDLCLEQINDSRDGGTLVNEMNSTVANSGCFYQTDFSGGGHCCWSNFYGGGGTAPGIFPIFGTNQTIYQWFASLVNPSAATTPVISSAVSATGKISTAFSYTITASNSPTSYSATGLPAGLSINTSTGVISGTPTVSGSFSVTIGAANASGSGSATLTLTITPAAPVISSAASATGTTGVTFSYNITASNTPTSYSATGLPTGLTVNTSTGVISGIPLSLGTSSVTIGAINAGGTGTKTLSLTINLGIPIISSLTSSTTSVGAAFSYTITASNTPTSYNATGLPAGLSINTSTGVISGTPTASGTFSVTISATNATGTATSTLSITVNAAAPVISSATSATGTVGTAFSYTITASNTPTSYNAIALPTGLSVNTATGIISGTPTTAGTSSVSISAINAGGTGTKTLSLTVNPAAPVISSAASATGTVGSAFSYTITASNTPTSYSATGLPTGLSVNTSTGVISGTPTTSGTYSVTINAINAGGTGTKTVITSISLATPIISSAASATGIIGTAFSYSIIVTNTSVSYYSATTLPAGLSLNTSTGVISGTPTTAGTSSVTISAVNSGGTGTKTLSIAINPIAPVISSAATATATVGTAFTYTITASNTPTSYNATGLPAGLSVNTSTGVISGTPTATGTSTVTINAINAGGTGTSTLSITVNPTAPVISSAATATATIGAAFTYAITASNTPTSYNASGLPAGLSVNTSTGIISGTPTTVGTSSVTISAINSGGTGTKTLSVTVNPAAPVISSAASATGIVGTAFAYAITASNAPTSYNATGLPTGLLINTSTGVISGTPTTAGTSSVTISAINAGGTGTKTLSIVISLATPVISSPTSVTGNVGAAFSYTITASNIPTSYNATGLPTGLSVNTSTGVISGTPTTAGTSSVTISAINSGGTGTKTLSIIISLTAPVISSAASATGNVGTAFSYTITASNTPTSYNATGLPAGLSVNTSTGVISGTPTASGTSSVTVSAINTSGTGTKTLSITINAAIPVISSAASATGVVGKTFSYIITASNTPTSYNATGLPAGLSVNTSTGTISGTPTTAGTYSVTISAINSGGTGNKTLSITVSPSVPVISSATSATATIGIAFSYSIIVSNTSVSNYSATGLPAGLSLNTSTGVISGTPTATGTYNVTIGAVNSGGTGTKTLTITVIITAPVISSSVSAIGTVGAAFTYTIIASNTPTSYSATGLPAGLSVNTSNGIISGTPTTAGTYNVTINAINAGGTGTKTLSITINAAIPVISSAATATGTAGTAFSYTIAASNTPTNYSATGLPAGLSIATSTGVISGTPTTSGTFSVIISATNAGGSGTATLTITINSSSNRIPAPPVISGSSTVSGITGTAFTYKITASNTPISYGASGLPTGFILNTTTGVISATSAPAGVFNITVSATNAGGTGTKELTITIGIPPVANAGSHDNITWALTTNNSVVVAGSINAGSMVQGTNFPSPGAYNKDGYKCAIVSGDWPTVATAGDNIDLPLLSNTSADLTITHLTFTTKLSGSSGSNIFSLAYQQDGTGTWTNFGIPQTALSGATTNIDFGTLSQLLPKGHAYTIRLYVYCQAATTTSSRNVYIKNISLIGTSAFAISLPTSSITLTGTGTDSDGTIAAYQWAKISGPTSGSIANASLAVTTVTGLVQGTYLFALTVTDNIGLTGTDTVQVTVNASGAKVSRESPTGTETIVTVPVNSVRVFPNPVHTTLTAEAVLSAVNQNAVITLTDMNGRTLYTKTIFISQQNTSVQINMSHFVTGMYLLNLNVGGKNISQKVIKN